ncbi:response regulator transcription factor [Spirosoma aureum]|uniref:Response regulator transcription factor n=1 Tax=Spirosoma aureum TaxID=2692134 RepID=A0A6G9AKX4_9BACT|nr:response regulator transcription factor [Spirosoma aureum]QIP12976.1 response regulator transcription factor [Spirosoma aureum]
MSKSILIADDHQLVRKGLQLVIREVLGFNSHVEFAENGTQVLEKLKAKKFDLLLTDLSMPETDELGMITNALSTSPGLKILVITVKPDKVFATRFFKAGVMGYVNKSESDYVLSEAISVISQGRRYISHSQIELFTNALIKNALDSPFDKLSNREFEVTLMLLKGFGAIEIAKSLSISASTASTFRCRIFSKLEINNLLELNHLAQQYQIPVDFENG